MTFLCARMADVSLIQVKQRGMQKQCVEVARALAMKPKLMQFDEATSALAPEPAEEVNLVMKGLAKENMTMIFVTHEIIFKSPNSPAQAPNKLKN